MRNDVRRVSKDFENCVSGIVDELLNYRMIASEDTLIFRIGAVAYAHPDNFWWGASKSGDLVKIRIFGDNCEGMGLRKAPNSAIFSLV